MVGKGHAQGCKISGDKHQESMKLYGWSHRGWKCIRDLDKMPQATTAGIQTGSTKRSSAIPIKPRLPVPLSTLTLPPGTVTAPAPVCWSH